MHDPHWQPYSVYDRMKNLGIHSNEFTGAYTSGTLPVRLNYSSDSLVWAKGLHMMEEEEFLRLFRVVVDGCREQHEQYRYLAIRATQEVR
jgi:hypothetical protein